MRFRSVLPVLLLVLVIGAGLGVRLALAPTVQNGDAVITQGWMRSAAQFGIAQAYKENITGGMLPTYPPFSLFLFQATGLLYRAIVSPTYEILQPAHLVFVKLPGMFAELGISVLLFLLFLSWKKPYLGVLAAALFALQPAAIYNSTIWGQTDSIYTLLVVASLFFFQRRAPVIGWMLMVLACLSKPQAVAFLPLALFLLPRSRRTYGLAFLGSITVLALVFSPFILQADFSAVLRSFRVLDVLQETHVSWNAYNVWWLVFYSTALRIPGTQTLFWLINYRHVGLLLWSVIYGVTIFFLRRLLLAGRNEERGHAIFAAAAIIAWSFFLFNAEMHERYLYPLIALGLPLALFDWRFLLLWLLATFGYLLNMLGVFPYSFLDQALYRSIPTISWYLALLQILLFGITVALLARVQPWRSAGKKTLRT